MKNEHLKNWEISLLLALCVTLCASCWAGGRSAAIAGSLVRLHVIADSDDEYEQAMKLRVRDSVLECLTPLLAGAEDAGEARDIIARSLPEVRRAAGGRRGGARGGRGALARGLSHARIRRGDPAGGRL